MCATPILSRFDSLNVWKRGGQRAPHKPLLVPYGLGRWTRGQVDVPFAEAEKDLTSLLKEFGPRQSYHPEYPLWRLQRRRLGRPAPRGDEGPQGQAVRPGGLYSKQGGLCSGFRPRPRIDRLRGDSPAASRGRCAAPVAARLEPGAEAPGLAPARGFQGGVAASATPTRRFGIRGCPASPITPAGPPRPSAPRVCSPASDRSGRPRPRRRCTHARAARPGSRSGSLAPTRALSRPAPPGPPPAP
jgi:hypothetical protein